MRSIFVGIGLSPSWSSPVARLLSGSVDGCSFGEYGSSRTKMKKHTEARVDPRCGRAAMKRRKARRSVRSSNGVDVVCIVRSTCLSDGPRIITMCITQNIGRGHGRWWRFVCYCLCVNSLTIIPHFELAGVQVAMEPSTESSLWGECKK